MSCRHDCFISALFLGLCGLFLFSVGPVDAQQLAADEANLKGYHLPKLQVGPGDWPQWGGSSLRNNTPVGQNIPADWDVETGKNIKWRARLGSMTYSSPVVANGKVYVGSNNGAGYINRFPWNDRNQVDLGVLLCFDEETGKFLWQHSNEKLKTGRRHDWPFQGIVSVPLIDGERLWYVTNRGEVVCLDTEGFRDKDNDGPYQKEEVQAEDEADVVWKFDMMGELGISQHNMCTCSLTSAGEILFVVTSNGVDESHINIPAPNAPAFFAMNKHTAEILWTDDSPNKGLLHGSWSSPAYAVLGGQPQVLFPGGDGWLYSFDPQGDGRGKSKLLWKFDCNPKKSKWRLGGRGNRNPYITMPVIYDNKVYVATGQDPEHGEGPGHLWCIDPAKKLDGSDVSPTLAVDANGKPLPFRKKQLVDPEAGETARPNPDSAMVWQYESFDLDGNGKIEWEETMHRSCGHVTIKDDLLFIAEFDGLVHCVNAQTGQPHWTHDLLSACWAASPLIVEGKVYIGNEDGDVTIFRLSAKKEILNTVNMGNMLYTTPIVANNVLFISNKNTLYAIAK